MLPKSLGQQEREDCRREAQMLDEILEDVMLIQEHVDRVFDRHGSTVKGLKVEDIKEVIDEWVAENDELLGSLWRGAHGLPS